MRYRLFPRDGTTKFGYILVGIIRLTDEAIATDAPGVLEEKERLKEKEGLVKQQLPMWKMAVGQFCIPAHSLFVCVVF